MRARNGTPAARTATGIVCSPVTARAGPALRGRGPPHELAHLTLELLPQLREGGTRRVRLDVDHHIHRRQPGSLAPSTEYLSCPTLQSVPRDGTADLATGGDPEAHMPYRARSRVECRQTSVDAVPAAVAPSIFCALAESLPRSQLLAPRRQLFAVRPQTLRRLRPFRRRLLNTARPFLVRIRARNPCFFARRRLFG